jgi:murein DD-endopeptidase MepM/ murein hydrolase activator NlpD
LPHPLPPPGKEKIRASCAFRLPAAIEEVRRAAEAARHDQALAQPQLDGNKVAGSRGKTTKRIKLMFGTVLKSLFGGNKAKAARGRKKRPGARRPATRHKNPVRLNLEAFEERLVPANLAITDLRVVPEASNVQAGATWTTAPITSVPEGTLATVHLDFTGQDLPATTYVVRLTLDNNINQVYDSQFFTRGFVGTLPGSVETRLPWALTAGSHTITAELDATNHIVETSKADNVKTIGLTAAGTFYSMYTGDTGLITPLAGTDGKDWSIINYVADNAEAAGWTPLGTTYTFHDYKGGNYTYPWHEGIDYTLANFAAMDAGVPVYAAAGGVVKYVHDGEFDRNTSENNLGYGNYIVIDHGNGWNTLYGHLRMGSITVHPGDVVGAGNAIALVGSSGSSSDPHLHFGVLYNGLIVDPYAVWKPSPLTGRLTIAPYWVNPLPYAGDVFGVVDYGTSGQSLDAVRNALTVTKERPIEQTEFQQSHPVTFWAALRGQTALDSFQMVVTEANGHQFSSEPAFVQFRNDFVHWWFTPSTADPTGWWTVDLERNGAVVASQRFFVSPAGQVNNGAFQFSNANYVVNENTWPPAPPQATITITRSAADGAATVDYSINSGTAPAGTNFLPATGTVSFAAGQQQAKITVPLIQDNSLHQPAETVHLVLSNPTGGATLGARSEADLTILDDDAMVTFTFDQQDPFLHGGILRVNAATDQSKDVVTFDQQGGMLHVTVDGEERVLSALLPQSLEINTGAGDASINLNTALDKMLVRLGAGNDTIIANAAASALTIRGGTGDDTLIINDQNPPPLNPGVTQSPTVYTVKDGGVERVTSLIYQDAFGPFVLTTTTAFDFISSGIKHVVVNGGPNGNKFVMDHPSVDVTINGGAGVNNAIVQAGGFGHSLHVQGSPGGTTTLTLDDSAEIAPHTYTLRDGSVTRDGGAAVSYSGVSSVKVIGSAGDDLFNIISTTAGAVTDVNGWMGNDKFVVQGDDGTMDAIRGALNLHGRFYDLPQSSSSIVFYDWFNQAAQTYDFTGTQRTPRFWDGGYDFKATQMTRTGLAPITFDRMASANLYVSSHADSTIQVEGVAGATSLILSVGSSATVKIGEPLGNGTATLADIRSPVFVSSYGSPTVVVDNSADTAAHALTAVAEPSDIALRGLAPAALEFQGVPAAKVQVLPGSGAVTGLDAFFALLAAAKPVLSPLPNQTSKAGDVVSLPVSAAGADGFTATGLPAGLQIDNKGVISGTIDPGAAGSYTVTVTAYNGGVASDPVTFTWAVNGL